jgi:hypothetical protein
MFDWYYQIIVIMSRWWVMEFVIVHFLVFDLVVMCRLNIIHVIYRILVSIELDDQYIMVDCILNSIRLPFRLYYTYSVFIN